MTRLFVCGVALGALLVTSLVAQAPVAKPVPRTADGKPDLSGVWIGGGFTLLYGDAELEAIRKYDEAMKRKPLPPPYRPEAEKRRQEYLARRGVDDPMARCLLSGVPRITVRPLPFEIFAIAAGAYLVALACIHLLAPRLEPAGPM